MNRYQRNIEIPQIGQTGQNKLFEAKVLVAGAGGLGSSVIANFACLGIGTLGIIDSDVLEITNFNRQFIHKTNNLGAQKVFSAVEFVQNLNPDVNVVPYALKLDNDNYEAIVAEYDVLVDCFDSYESKFLMNEICVKTSKPLIHAGVTEFGGQVTTIIPEETACLCCLFGDSINESYIPKGVISPAVSTIGSIQAFETVKLITGTGELLKNRLLTFDGLNMRFKELKIAKNHRCSLCGK